MSLLKNVRSGLDQRGRSLVGYSADLVEWSAEKNLAVAGDIASFVVAQMRLPIEARSFAEYRTGMRQSVSGLGETLFEHAKDVASKTAGVPRELWQAVNRAPRRAARKPSAQTVATKKAAARKHTTIIAA